MKEKSPGLDVISEMDVKPWRFELKYRVNAFDFYRLRNAIRPFAQPDNFTIIAPPGGYLVRTLYFDTFNLKSYHEKMNGDHERIKFRLRTYTREFNDQTEIRAEMKVRKGNAMEKYGVMISPDEYLHFIQTKHWPLNSNPVLQEFERHVHLWGLRPQVLVEYQREGYHDRDKKGIRITFDQKVKGAHSSSLFPDQEPFFRHFQPQTVIVEIKCRNDHPDWLRNLIRNHGLKWIANSKFTHGIQSAKHDLYHPGGVVIVR